MEELFYKIQDFAIRYSELITLVGVIGAWVGVFKFSGNKQINNIKDNTGTALQSNDEINIGTINNAGRDIHVREKNKSKNHG